MMLNPPVLCNNKALKKLGEQKVDKNPKTNQDIMLFSRGI